MSLLGEGRRTRLVDAITVSLIISLVISTLCATQAVAETIPEPLRSDISVRRVLVTEHPAAVPTRIVKDPRDSTLYYLKQSGEIYRVNLVAGTSALVASNADHGLRNTQGMAIGPDGTIYLVGNRNLAGSLTQGIIAKGVPQGGSRVWSILAQTVGYPKSNTAYDHRMNGIVVNLRGSFIYVNSGSRTDHGEIQSAGGLFPDVREVGLTACILKLPTSGQNIVLQNDRTWLKEHGYIYAEGTRNTFDMAFDADGRLFGGENGPDRDTPEELNLLRPGGHYGFPWNIGGSSNPQQFPDYNPNTDRLLNPLFNAVKLGYYQNDPTFPPAPSIPMTGALRNFGPDADSFRGPNGVLRDASDRGSSITTFTAHRSPLGLVFDRDRLLAPEFRGDGFILGWNAGDPAGDSVAGPFNDASQDMLHLNIARTSSGYILHATRIVERFNNPIDAEIIGNRIYVLDYGGSQSIWEVTLPN